MALSSELIDFRVIEEQKENIQSLPGGRSAKKLVELYSPSPLHKLATPTTPTDTKSVHDCIRAEYEAEIQNLAESDDPLDVFDRYVRWTLDAFPSAQATPHSQLHTLLERATKAFIASSQYKNDSRYLRIWLHYIHFFSDSPRETFMFLSRHGIGEGLALFYEEYAAWLEGAGRWTQAEEVFQLGIQRESRPVQRLMRKFKEFQERLAQQPDAATAPSSPALPVIRPALAAKVDPFAHSRSTDLQAPQQANSSLQTAAKVTKSKLAIFSDATAEPSPLSLRNEKPMGWDTIGSLSTRRKENVMEPKPWVGETLKAGSRKSAAPKLSVFKDSKLSEINTLLNPSKNQVTVHAQTGKREYIFIDLQAVYPASEETDSEMSFEEIIARYRGWLGPSKIDRVTSSNELPLPKNSPGELERISQDFRNMLSVHRDSPLLDENGEVRENTQPPGPKKKKVMEVNETQIIKAKLDSPSGPKFRKKQSSEPTMTMHTRAATDDIYDIFNAPLGLGQVNDDVEDENYETDGDYTTDIESAGATRQLDIGSEHVEDGTEAQHCCNQSELPTGEPTSRVIADELDTNQAPDGSFNLTSPDRKDLQHEDEAGNGLSADNEHILVHDMETLLPGTKTVFVPIPPEDYDAPTRPYRDPAEMANNRLPFMTPITERTECSIDVELEPMETFKTPCRRDMAQREVDDPSDCDLLSSPLREIMEDSSTMPRLPNILKSKSVLVTEKLSIAKSFALKGPIIKDIRCNPVDEAVRNEILDRMQPPLTSYAGFFDRRGQTYEHGGEIRKSVKAQNKLSKNGGERTGPLPATHTIEFPGTSRRYNIRKELGAGAFAPVYLVENIGLPGDEDKGTENRAPISMGRGAFATAHRNDLEAMKMETPPSPWEFYVMRLAHNRLGPQHRATTSLSYAHELQLFQDEAFLFLSYHPHGTLLDVVNLFRAEPSGVMDEQLAMFFTIELLRTVESLHTSSILHGDLKPDNCLFRLDSSSLDLPLSTQWQADGSGGWAARGIILIDFGRGIDMKAFVPDVEFIADWKTSAQDCAEMREGRPWTWQIDYHGLAGIVHCLLFGKYIETARRDQGGLGRAGRQYKIRENLKRYWQTDLWSDCFEILLNPASFVEAEDRGKMPLLRSMRSVRVRMEEWLTANCERGIGLKTMLSKLEGQVKSRK